MTAKDLLYVALSLAFFGAMLAYVRFCVRLGQADPDAAEGEGTR